MLKQTITYKDFDDNTQTDTVYFNITKSELSDNLDLEDEMKEIQSFFEAEQHILTVPEITKTLGFVKRIMKIAYGVRSADGKRFAKTTPEGYPLWNEFVQTMAYDTFLFSLFENPNECFAFINGVLPKEIVEQARQMQAEQGGPDLFNSDATSAVPVPEDNRPIWIRENRKPRPAELQTATKEQLAYAMQVKQQG